MYSPFKRDFSFLDCCTFKSAFDFCATVFSLSVIIAYQNFEENTPFPVWIVGFHNDLYTYTHVSYLHFFELILCVCVLAWSALAKSHQHLCAMDWVESSQNVWYQSKNAFKLNVSINSFQWIFVNTFLNDNHMYSPQNNIFFARQCLQTATDEQHIHTHADSIFGWIRNPNECETLITYFKPMHVVQVLKRTEYYSRDWFIMNTVQTDK